MYHLFLDWFAEIIKHNVANNAYAGEWRNSSAPV